MLKDQLIKQLDLIIKELKNNKDIQLSYHKNKDQLIIRRVSVKKLNK